MFVEGRLNIRTFPIIKFKSNVEQILSIVVSQGVCRFVHDGNEVKVH